MASSIDAPLLRSRNLGGAERDGQAVAVLRRQVLRGNFMAADPKKWGPPSFKLLVFVSSTFTDTHKERNILLDRILPRLRERSQQHGIEVTFIDMRYGVRDENTLDHLTWVACLKELQRCHNTSAGLFFISLQGEKYGYMPIPKYLPQDLFESTVAQSFDTESVMLAQDWYRLDANNLPPRYLLRNLTGESSADSKFWQSVLPSLRGLFAGSAFDPSLHNDEVQIGRSVTDYEVTHAMQLDRAQRDEQRSRCVWLNRTFPGGVAKDDKASRFWDYDDCDSDEQKGKMSRLLAAMHGHFEGNVRRYDGVSFAEYVVEKSEAVQSYLEQWETDTHDMLGCELDYLIEKSKQWRSDGGGLGVEGEALADFLHHALLANEKCRHFEGRQELVAELVDKALERHRAPAGKALDGVDLVVVGQSGSGKTSLMAKLAQQLVELELERQTATAKPGRPVIFRFCGTNKNSYNGLSLVHSVCMQIAHVLRLGDVLAEVQQHDNASDYTKMVALLHKLLNEHAVILLVDSLDQLLNEHNARRHISFLSGVTPHADTRIIVSTLPDERSPLTRKWIYFYGCDTVLHESQVPRTVVHTFDNCPGEAQDLFAKVLAQRSRTLTPTQMSKALVSIMQEPTALYINLAAMHLENVTSEQGANFDLPGGVQQLIAAIFARLEVSFGRPMTRLALALITYAVQGVNDVEIEDLLTLDDDVLNSVFQYSAPGIRRLPSHIWLRLRGDLAGLLEEQQGGCLSWAHRQLKETAFEYFRPERAQAHFLMARYFGNLVPDDLRLARLIASQPLVFVVADDHSVATSPWHPRAQINRRRCSESGHHLVQSGARLHAETTKELCNFEYIIACVKSEQSASMTKNLNLHVASLRSAAATAVPTNSQQSTQHQPDDPSLTRAGHYLRWLNKALTLITNPRFDPCVSLMGSISEQPLESVVRSEMTRYVQAQRELTSSSSEPDYDFNGFAHSDSWFRMPQVLNGFKHFDECLATYHGHAPNNLGRNESVACFSPDDLTVISGAEDRQVKIWDNLSGSELSSMRAQPHHTWSRYQMYGPQIFSLATNKSGSLIGSGHDDKTAHVWDSVSSTELAVLVGHEEKVTCVQFYEVDKTETTYLFTGSHDGTVRRWNVDTGEFEVYQIGAPVNSLAVNEGERLFVVGCESGDVSTWSVHEPKKLLGLSMVSQLTSDEKALRVATKDRFVAAGGHFGSVYVWNLHTGEKVATLLESKYTSLKVHALAFAHRSNHLAVSSGLLTNKIVIYDVVSAAPIKTFSESRNHCLSLSFSSHDDLLTAGTTNGDVLVFDAAVQEEASDALEERNDAIWTSFAISPQMEKIATVDDHDVVLWDRATNTSTHLKGHTYIVNCLAYSADGSIFVSGSSDDSVIIWDGRTGAKIKHLHGHRKQATPAKAGVGPGADVMDDLDALLAMLNAPAEASTSASTEPLLRSVIAVAVSHNGKLIVSGSEDDTAKSWDALTGACLATFTGHSKRVKSVAISSDSKWVGTASDDGTAKVWPMTVNAALVTYRGHSNSYKGVDRIAFSNDCTKAITAWSVWNQAEFVEVHVWSSTTGAPFFKVAHQRGALFDLAVSPDDRVVATTSDNGSVCIIRLTDGSVVQTLAGHNQKRCSVLFARSTSQEIHLLTSAKTINVWEAIKWE